LRRGAERGPGRGREGRRKAIPGGRGRGYTAAR